MRKVPAEVMTGPMARPSSPSVRLTALLKPASTVVAKMKYRKTGQVCPSMSWSKWMVPVLKKGNTRSGSIQPIDQPPANTPKASPYCPSSLYRPLRPAVDWYITFFQSS